MNSPGYILASIKDIYDDTIIVPIAPSREIYYISPTGTFSIDEVIQEIQYDKGEWVKSLFGLYVYNPLFSKLNKYDEIINIVIGSKVTKVYSQIYIQAYKIIKQSFDICKRDIMIDIEFETKLSIIVHLPNNSYAASRLFTNGDIIPNTDDYYIYILYIGQIYELTSEKIIVPTTYFKVGSTSRSFNERYEKYFKGDASFRKIKRSHFIDPYIKLVESDIIPPFIDTEATISCLVSSSLKEDIVDKRTVKDLLDGSNIKLRFDNIIYDSYYLAMCKLYNYKTLKFNNHKETRGIFSLSKGEISNITEKYISFINNLMIKSLNDKSSDSSHLNSDIMNYMLDKCRKINIISKDNDDQKISTNIHNTSSNNTYSFSTGDISGNNIINSPLYKVNTGVIVKGSTKQPDINQRIDKTKIINLYVMRLCYIIKLLIIDSCSSKIINNSIIDKIIDSFCEYYKLHDDKTNIKDKINNNLNSENIYLT